MCADTEVTGGNLSQYPYLDCDVEAPKNCNLILNTPEGQKEKVTFKHNEQIEIPLYSRGYRTANHSCGWYMHSFKCINGEMVGGDYSIDQYNYLRCYKN